MGRTRTATWTEDPLKGEEMHEDKEPIGTSPSNSRDECLEIRATVAVHPLGGVEVDPRFIILVVL
jgi:hypothetical protein